MMSLTRTRSRIFLILRVVQVTPTLLFSDLSIGPFPSKTILVIVFVCLALFTYRLSYPW